MRLAVTQPGVRSQIGAGHVNTTQMVYRPASRRRRVWPRVALCASVVPVALLIGAHVSSHQAAAHKPVAAIVGPSRGMHAPAVPVASGSVAPRPHASKSASSSHTLLRRVARDVLTRPLRHVVRLHRLGYRLYRIRHPFRRWWM